MQFGLENEFKGLWESAAAAPDVFVFLDGHADADLSDKLTVIAIDQQHRWQTPQPLLVEDYLKKLPEIGADQNSKLHLVVGEFMARQDSGALPAIDEYVSRFSDIGDELRSKLSELTRVDSGDVQIQDQNLAITRTFISGSAGGELQIGRYRLIRLIGEGTFGRVYLAFDTELQRHVAIKVPSPRRFRGPEDAQSYLAEARTVASLDHPNIVPVYDIGQTESGGIYIVSKFIEGETLFDLIEGDRPSCDEAARLTATIAEALYHAHQKRLVHRDIKPRNILIEDSTGQPYITDFGLAIREEDYMHDGIVAGTPAYMSPEQIRGEGHRLDGRSDVFSLGVIFYQLLTGRKPFRGGSSNEFWHQVVSVDPTPPHELDPDVPLELERICLKMLAKRAAERYATAGELAEDLNHWQQSSRPQGNELKIVPRGLRSFDSDDSDFFLDLLPGLRDRHGLPESIKFWKTGLEETDPDKVFRVGLIYGPSGCGKSSFVKAGLFPRLSRNIIAIYVEATPDETEARILRALRKLVPGLPADLGLVETFTRIRRDRADGHKVIVVLDQFEQWLHAHRADQAADLVSALRQCDGCGLQAVVMVRDDFSMAVSRFMREIENPILEGHNFATVDLFDVEHAQKVLIKFGQAFGRLPSPSSRMSDDERRFVTAAASDLAREGKVVPVRLSLFAEMVKGKPWTPPTLDEVGGTAGIGARYLEETFSGRGANPEHRTRADAARKVLKALLPQVGTDIKGCMRSHAELLEVAGLQNPGEFGDLVRILDGELRLITPTDPEGMETTATHNPKLKHYQLTHDYLVTSLREWLTRKQRETRAGQAELRLAERVALWDTSPQNRYLPSAWEYLSILLLTSRDAWTEPERRMMDRSRRVYTARWLISLLILVTIGTGIAAIRHQVLVAQNHQRADGLVNRLLVADIAEAPRIVMDLQKDSYLTTPMLESAADDQQRTPAERLRATMALANGPGARAGQLIDYASQCDLATLTVIRDRISPYAPELSQELWSRVKDDSTSPPPRLRLSALLSMADPTGDGWQNLAPAIVSALLAENTLDLDSWAELLRPASRSLTPGLRLRFDDETATPTERARAARVLARYASADVLAELLFSADATRFSILFPATAIHRNSVIDAAVRTVQQEVGGAKDDARLFHARRRRNAVATLLRLQRLEEAESTLAASADPTTRTMLILEMRDFDVPPEVLVRGLTVWKDPAARQAALLALEPFRKHDLTAEMQQSLFGRLRTILQTSPYVVERSAAEWLLRKWDQAQVVDEVSRELARRVIPATSTFQDRDWWVTTLGHTMAVVRAPVTFDYGSPEDEAGREGDEIQTRKTISQSFAVSIHEVTLQQFKEFQPDAEFATDVAGDPHCPANKITFVRAMQYCRWLSDKEMLNESDMCYPPIDEIVEGNGELTPEQQARTGYRLPTEEEWEYACRAGATTRWSSGVNEDQLGEFAWFALSAGQRLHPIGSLRPNQLGFFDLTGNIAEWCHSDLTDGRFMLRGGHYDLPTRRVRSAERYPLSNRGYSFTGFRIARSIGVR